MNAKLRELKIKEKTLKQMVPIEAFNKLKDHLKRIIKMHQEFRERILGNNNILQGPDMRNNLLANNLSLTMPNYQMTIPSLNLDESERFLKEMKQSFIKDSAILNEQKIEKIEDIHKSFKV